MNDIEEMEQEFIRTGIGEPHKLLASEMTRFVHGDNELRAAQQASSLLFGAEVAGTDLQLSEIFDDVPSLEIPRSRLESLDVFDAFFESGLSTSKSAARRTFEQGGLYINNRRVMARILGPSDLASESLMVLRSGKKNYALVRFV
jgi:tyrosyl-tRNA synthetase